MVAGLPLQRSSRRHGAPTDRAMFAAAPRCEAEADARCVLVSAAGTLMESACHQAPRTMHVRVVWLWRASGLAEADSRCVLVSAAGTLVQSACRHDQAPDTSVQVLCLCNGSRHQAPTDRARWRLLHGARRRPTQGACSSLPLALRCRVLAARTKDPHRCSCFAFATEAAIKLRRVEQGGGCSMPTTIQRHILLEQTGVQDPLRHAAVCAQVHPDWRRGFMLHGQPTVRRRAG